MSIELGRKSEDITCCGGDELSDGMKKMDYPGTGLRFTGDDDPDLPKEGTMVVKFSVRRKSVEETGKGVRVEYSIDLHEIESVKKTKSEAKPEVTTEEALDKLMSEAEEEED